MRRIGNAEALRFLKDSGADDALIAHSEAVSKVASDIASRMVSNGLKADVEFIESAALLHDLGRTRTHGILHGVEGAAILKDYPEYARVCERHIGGGIGRLEAGALGLPVKDYIPETVEEKVVCYADKLVHGTRVADIGETVENFRRRLGRDHPTVGRILELHREIQEWARRP